MRKTVALLLTVATVATVATPALAQHSASQNRGASHETVPSNQVLTFGDEIVQDSLVRPDGASSHVLRRAAGISLIRLRMNFVDAMGRSVENL